MRWGRLKLGFTLIVLAGLLILGFIKYGTILGFFLIYPWIVSKVLGVVINPDIAVAIAAAVAMGLIYLWIRFLSKWKSRYGYVIVGAIIVIQSLFMFFGERNRFFSLTTGQPIKYYTINPDTREVQVFDRPIYDQFGVQAQPVDYSIARQIYRQQHGTQFPNTAVAFDKLKNFFDPMTGQSLVWYCQNQTGYHFFVHSGYDPTTGRKLMPITSEIVEQYQLMRQGAPKTPASAKSGATNSPTATITIVSPTMTAKSNLPRTSQMKTNHPTRQIPTKTKVARRNHIESKRTSSTVSVAVNNSASVSRTQQVAKPKSSYAINFYVYNADRTPYHGSTIFQARGTAKSRVYTHNTKDSYDSYFVFNANVTDFQYKLDVEGTNSTGWQTYHYDRGNTKHFICVNVNEDTGEITIYSDNNYEAKTVQAPKPIEIAIPSDSNYQAKTARNATLILDGNDVSKITSSFSVMPIKGDILVFRRHGQKIAEAVVTAVIDDEIGRSMTIKTNLINGGGVRTGDDIFRKHGYKN